MKDVILISLIALAESDKQIEQDVTLLVGGFLVSGFVISYKTYSEHNPITSNIEKVIEELKETKPIESQQDKHSPNFIHLRDAKYYHTTGNPIPGNTGVYIRIPLSSVHGFSFGKLEIGQK